MLSDENDNYIDNFIQTVTRLSNPEDCYAFFEGICSADELKSMAMRLEASRQLMQSRVYSDVVTGTGISPFVVNRLDRSLQNGGLGELLRRIDRPLPASYGAFAYIYDRLTSNVNYPARVSYVEKLFKRYGKKPKLVLDLACGTGSASILLSRKGYEVIGVDSSEDMLSVALEKSKAEGLDILFLCQRMERLDLYGTVDAAICLQDSLNYITDYGALKKTFKLVANFLNPGGIFIFDINTRHMLKDVLPGSAIVDGEDDNVIYTWESFYDGRRNICEFVLNFFVKQDGLYRRITETHRQKAYTAENIKSALKAAGLNLVGEFDDLSLSPPNQGSTKVFYAAVRE